MRERELNHRDVELLVDFLRRSREFIQDKSESVPFPFFHLNIESSTLHTKNVRNQFVSILESLGVNRSFFLNTSPPQDCEERDECTGYLGEIFRSNTENFEHLLREKGAFFIVNKIREELFFSLSVSEAPNKERLH